MADLLRQLAGLMDGDFRPQAEVIPAQAPGGAPCVSAACSSSGMLPQLAEAEASTSHPACDTSSPAPVPSLPLLSALATSIVTIAAASLRLESLTHSPCRQPLATSAPHPSPSPSATALHGEDQRATTSKQLSTGPASLHGDQSDTHEQPATARPPLTLAPVSPSYARSLLLTQQQGLHSALLSASLASQACAHTQEVHDLSRKHQRQMVRVMCTAKQDLAAARALAQTSVAHTRSAHRLCSSLLAPSPDPPAHTTQPGTSTASHPPTHPTPLPSTAPHSRPPPTTRSDTLSRLPDLLHRCSIALRKQRQPHPHPVSHPDPLSSPSNNPPCASQQQRQRQQQGECAPSPELRSGGSSSSSSSSSAGYELVPSDVQSEPHIRSHSRMAHTAQAATACIAHVRRLQGAAESQLRSWQDVRCGLLLSEAQQKAVAVGARGRERECMQRAAELQLQLDEQTRVGEELLATNRALESMFMASLQVDDPTSSSSSGSSSSSSSSFPLARDSSANLEQMRPEPLKTLPDTWPHPSVLARECADGVGEAPFRAQDMEEGGEGGSTPGQRQGSSTACAGSPPRQRLAADRRAWEATAQRDWEARAQRELDMRLESASVASR
ncbi:MAG: hypothetical protein WDW36_000249 [Sanguina aurantia]